MHHIYILSGCLTHYQRHLAQTQEEITMSFINVSILAFDAATFVWITNVYIFGFLLPIVPLRIRWCKIT